MSWGSFALGMGHTQEGMKDTARQNEQDALAALRAEDAYRAERDRRAFEVGAKSMGTESPYKLPSASSVGSFTPVAAPAAVAPAASTEAEGGMRPWDREDGSHDRVTAARAQTNAEERLARLRKQESQAARDRRALLTAPAAAVDVFQAPMAVAGNIVSGTAGTLQGLGNRVYNAVAGRDVLPTDVTFRKFSMTPATDALRRADPTFAASEDKARLDALRASQAGEPSASVEPPAAYKSQYDKPTQYDALIDKSAREAGVDPVVFKRLLGTESSFNPSAVSPRGEQYGLGIAQIAASHGLSREQRLDPNVAVPYAAKYFGDLLRKTNGNVEAAVQLYKGASSEAGKASIAGAVRQITGSPAAPGSAPQQAAAAPAPEVTQSLALVAQQDADGTLRKLQNDLRYAQLKMQTSSDRASIDQARNEINAIHAGIFHAQVQGLAGAAMGGNTDALIQLAQAYANSNTGGHGMSIGRSADGGWVRVARGPDGRPVAASKPMSQAEMAMYLAEQISPVTSARMAAYRDAEMQKFHAARGEAQGKFPAESAIERMKLDNKLHEKMLELGLKGDEYRLTDNQATGQRTVLITKGPNAGTIGFIQEPQRVVRNGVDLTPPPTIEWKKSAVAVQ